MKTLIWIWCAKNIFQFKGGFVTGQVNEPCFDKNSLISCNFAWERLTVYTVYPQWGLNYIVPFPSFLHFVLLPCDTFMKRYIDK